MEMPQYFASSLILIFTTTLFLTLLHRLKATVLRGKLPPGPPGWPIIGNLLDLGTMPHRTLKNLQHKYGDVIWLRLGVMNTMVILSAKSASEFFKNHDLSFAERTITETMRVHDYEKGSLALAPYGSYWRALRRLVTVDMLVAKKINETAPIRRKCFDNMIVWLKEESIKSKGSPIQVARFVFLTTFNLLGNLMLSKDLLDPESKDGAEFFGAMMGLMEWGGYANLADYFPVLKKLDPQGLRRKMDRDLGRALKVASKFVKERIEEKKEVQNKEDIKKDFLDVLLEFEGNGRDESDKLSDHDINIFILEIFMAGSETTSSTTEWALTELLRDPDSMSEVKQELKKVVGPNRKVEESDLDNLPYLQAVVKETLRLHPPIPFLVPRKAIQDTQFMGYKVPKDTQVLVNTWTIGRDPSVWDDPLKFKPTRFSGSKVDYKGQHYEFIPFGAGRRMCAGVPLAHRMLHLLLGSLLHQFDFELERNVSPKDVDMNDRLGVVMRKREPLLVVVKSRV